MLSKYANVPGEMRIELKGVFLPVLVVSSGDSGATCSRVLRRNKEVKDTACSIACSLSETEGDGRT